MKKILIFVIAIYPAFVSGQVQDGNLCFFTCMNHLCPSKSARQYGKDMAKILGLDQDFINDGVQASPRVLMRFIMIEFEPEFGFVNELLDKKIPIMTTIEYRRNHHSIVLESMVKGRIRFYDPADGRHHYISFAAFMRQEPLYIIGIKK